MESSMLLRGLIIPVLSMIALAIPIPAFAQTQNYASHVVAPGRPLQLSYHASAKKNCEPAPLPTVRVIDAPHSGILTVRKAQLKTNKIAGCPNLKIPADVVFYRAHANATGTDHVRYEVTSADGKVEIFDVQLQIKASVPAVAPPQGSRI